MTKIERRDFKAELVKIDKECDEAIKAIFSHYGLKQLFLIDSYSIDEYNSINGISIENPCARQICGRGLRDWFFLHSEGNGWFAADFYDPLGHAEIYDLIVKTIDCLIANNVPISE